MLRKLTFLLMLTFAGWQIMAQPCTDIFFSEYVEGSSNNKAIEVYNPLAGSVDLSTYTFLRLNGGSSTVSSYTFSAILASGDVYVIANSNADSAILAQADTTSALTFYNGDDALLIISPVGDTIDAFGDWGVDPGSNWSVGTGASNENTLVRKTSVQEGNDNDWLGTKDTEWDVFLQNDFSHLGSHSMISCGSLIPAELNIAPSSINVLESAGSVTFDVTILNSNSDTSSVDVVFDILGSTATMGIDFSFTNSTVVFPGNSVNPVTLTLNLNDDNAVEGSETISIVLQNPDNADFGVDTVLTINILDDDQDPADNCSDLFFSEYVEGTGNNKALEVYNPTGAAVDFSSYMILKYTNGSTFPGDTFMSNMIIPAAGVMILTTTQADSALAALADTAMAFPSVVHFNGNDAVELINGSTSIDVIGQIGENPGVNWPVDTGATSEFTLVRKSSVQQGSTVWPLGATGWDVYPQNDWSHLGSHNMDPCQSCDAPISLWTDKISPNSARLNWDTVSGAYAYQIRGRNINNPGFVTIFIPNGTPNYKDIGGLTNGGTYIWQIQTVCNPSGSNISAWSVLDTFTTFCQTPDSNWASNLTTSTVVLNWVKVKDAAGYEIQGRVLGSPSSRTILAGSFHGTRNIAGLQENTTFEFRVRTWCDVNGIAKSDWTPWVAFTTLQSPARFAGTVNQNNSLTMYPNPSANDVYLEFDNASSSAYSLTISDINGKMIKKVDGISTDSYVIKRDGLEAGIYFVELKGVETYRSKLIIQ